MGTPTKEMLTRKKQCRFLTEKEQQWLRQLELFAESHDEEALHRLRIEVKKIRALVHLMAVQSGKRAAGHFHGLKRMFRQAGMIRDAGSQARWLEERELLSPGQRTRRMESMRAASDAFAARIGRYRHSGKKASKQILTDIHPIHAGRIRRWFAREILGIGMLLSSERDEIHDARKKLKTILYVHKLLPTAIREQIPLNTDYLDRLQDAIGQWHDAVMVSGGPAAEGATAVPEVNREMRDKYMVVKELSGEFAIRVHSC